MVPFAFSSFRFLPGLPSSLFPPSRIRGRGEKKRALFSGVSTRSRFSTREPYLKRNDDARQSTKETIVVVPASPLPQGIIWGCIRFVVLPKGARAQFLDVSAAFAAAVAVPDVPLVYLSSPFRSAFRRERELSEPPELSAIFSPDPVANSTAAPLHPGEKNQKGTRRRTR